MPNLYESSFNYNITRPYPFRWFTWVVVIGGVVATALLSVANLAADGYILKTIYSTDPNSTVAEYADLWYEKSPWSWTNKMSASCEPELLTIGNSYFSTNRGLTYTLNSIWQGNATNLKPATPYLNEPLNCTVSLVYIEFLRADLRTTGNDIYPWANSYAEATATCTLPAQASSMFFNLTVRLPQMFDITYDRLLNSFQRVDSSVQPSLWWGAQLMSQTYRALGGKMSSLAPGPDGGSGSYGGGDIHLTHGNVQDLESLGFFLSHWHFRDVIGDTLYFAPCNDTGYVPLGQVLDLDCESVGGHPVPDLVTQVEVFTKSFYSTVLTDLGQNETNLLLHGDSLEYLQDLADIDVPTLTQGLPNTAPQDLKVTPASLFMTYQCSVPVLKGVGSVIQSVVLADLVFLNFFWLVLNWLSVWWLNRQDKTTNYCRACRGQNLSSGSELLLSHGTKDHASAVGSAISLGNRGGYAHIDNSASRLSPEQS